MIQQSTLIRKCERVELQLYCVGCGKKYDPKICPLYTTTTGSQTYKVCPVCPTNRKLKKGTKDRKWARNRRKKLLL